MMMPYFKAYLVSMLIAILTVTGAVFLAAALYDEAWIILLAQIIGGLLAFVLIDLQYRYLIRRDQKNRNK